MSTRTPAPRVDAALDDWLGEAEVDWGDDPRGAPRAAGTGGEAASTASLPGAAPSRIDPGRRDDIRRRRAIALIGLLALVLAGVAVAIVLAGGDEPAAPTTAPATTTEPALTQPPAATTQPPAETPTFLTVTLPESGALALGASGAEVETLQTALAALDFDPGAADGDFGEGTQAAVRAFQEANDLPADGIVGPGTVERLNAVLAEQGITG